MDAHFSIQVNSQQKGLGLLACLLPCIPYLNDSQWLALLDQGFIKLDGKTITEDCVLSQGQVIDYTVPNYQEDEVNTHWTILWQNHEIAAVHKPANLPVSRTTRNVYNTLIQILRRESPWPDAHLLHRLDLETSGIILIAQNNDMAKQYQPRLSELMQRKIYHAVVKGTPDWQTIRHCSYLNTLKESAIRCQMHPVEEAKGKLSETGFKVLTQGNGYSIIECELFSGRKHQIRAHLAELGYPIVGDKIYSEDGEYYLKRLADALSQDDLDNWPSEHHLLHAFEVHVRNIWQTSESNIVIQDDAYPDEWVTFCKQHGLSEV